LILRPLLLTCEEIRSYLGAVSLVRFFADKEMNKYFETQHLKVVSQALQFTSFHGF
jgi:hypothetical protein